jgi:hypothetical protein
VLVGEDCLVMVMVSKEEEKRGISTVYVPDPPNLNSIHGDL